MKKRFIILIIILITLISLTSCGKIMTIDKAKKEASEILKSEMKYLNIIGKFDKGYVVSSNAMFGFSPTEIDGYTIPHSKDLRLFYIVDGRSISLYSAYYLGYIAKEDLYVIGERLAGDNGKKDYPLIDPNANLDRCIHEPGEWKTTTEATCTTGGIEEIYCKKCDKLLKTIEHLNIPHKYQNGKCVNCEELEYTYIDEYEESPSNMLSFYGTYTKKGETKQGKCTITISVFGIEYEKYHGNKNEGYKYNVLMVTPQKRRKFDLDIIFSINNNTNMKVQYIKKYTSGIFKGNKETKLLDLDIAYREGLINKNILIDVRNRIWEENKVGNYIYEHYEDKESYKDLPKEIYLNYGEYICNLNKSFEVFDRTIKNIDHYSGYSISFYNKYNDYYVGNAYNKLEYSDEETKVRVAGYKFEIEPYHELVVFNEEKVYDIKTAYRKGILTKENIKEIYEFHLFFNKED